MFYIFWHIYTIVCRLSKPPSAMWRAGLRLIAWLVSQPQKLVSVSKNKLYHPSI